MNGHIADRAGFLAALSSNDAERKLAEQHAHSCFPCAEALEEGQRLMTLLAEAAPLEAPTPAALERAASAIEAETVAEHGGWRLVKWGAAGALAAVWMLQLLYGAKLAPDPRGVTVSLGLLTAAIAAITFLGPRRPGVAAVVVALSGVVAYATGGGTALEPKAGVECTACELVGATISWLVVTGLARARHIALDRVTTMAAAAAGALASQAGQILSCPVAHARPHLLVFHLGGVLLALALGAVNPLRVRPLSAAS